MFKKKNTPEKNRDATQPAVAHGMAKLTDDDLGAVSGGSCRSTDYLVCTHNEWICDGCGTKKSNTVIGHKLPSGWTGKWGETNFCPSCSKNR